MIDKPEIVWKHENRDERDHVIKREIKHMIMPVCPYMFNKIEKNQIDGKV